MKPSTESNDNVENEIVLSIQQAFIENSARTKAKNEDGSLPHILEKKSYLLLVEETSSKDSCLLIKKITEYLEPLQNDAMLIRFNANDVPSYFTELNPVKIISL